MKTAVLQTISPIDGAVYVEREYASEAAINTALDNASRGAKALQALSLTERIAICERALEYFEAQRDAIAEEICRQMGRPLAHSAGEVSGVQERARFMMQIAATALADIVPKPVAGFKRFIRREPLGTILVIAPWNYPLLTATNAIFPALLAGNSVVIKPSAQTPLSAERFVTAFEQAGLPDAALQCLHLDHGQTEALITRRAVDFVCFTGSVEAGRKLSGSAASQFLGIGLELGGKDPAYVRADADLEYCVAQLVDGAFYNAGQSCCGIERIYVHDSLYATFIEQYASLAGQYKLGNPLEPGTTLGPLVKPAAANWVRRQIKEAAAAGAKGLLDIKEFAADDGQGCYLAPQVMIDVDHSMSIMREESFGPAVGIMPVKNDAQALALMNDSNLGLTASIWTGDATAAEKLAGQIQTGTVFMNRCDYLDPALAWTGVKDTGHGISLSALGYQQLTRAKSCHFKLETR